eukprot:1195142-Prorocentrum_minimum.AAC.5
MSLTRTIGEVRGVQASCAMLSFFRTFTRDSGPTLPPSPPAPKRAENCSAESAASCGWPAGHQVASVRPLGEIRLVGAGTLPHVTVV